MATRTIMGLKACYAGPVGADGAAGTSLTPIKQPYQGTLTITGTSPTKNPQYRENEKFPAVSAEDVSTGGYEASWEVMDFDDETLKFYFGDAAVGGIPVSSFSGEKTFRFDDLDGDSILIPRLQYSAVVNGPINSTEALRISVTGTVLAPKEGEMAIGIIDTPAPSPANASAPLSAPASGSSKAVI